MNKCFLKHTTCSKTISKHYNQVLKIVKNSLLTIQVEWPYLFHENTSKKMYISQTGQLVDLTRKTIRDSN